jgi:hypothetical protein
MSFWLYKKLVYRCEENVSNVKQHAEALSFDKNKRFPRKHVTYLWQVHLARDHGLPTRAEAYDLVRLGLS